MSADSPPWPTELRVDRAAKTLSVTFDDGAAFTFPAEFLRVESPSAEVQGHGPGQKTIVAGRRHVGIMDLEPVGNYAVRIMFDDLHSTGHVLLALSLPPRPQPGAALGGLSPGARRAGPEPRSVAPGARSAPRLAVPRSRRGRARRPCGGSGQTVVIDQSCGSEDNTRRRFFEGTLTAGKSQPRTDFGSLGWRRATGRAPAAARSRRAARARDGSMAEHAAEGAVAGAAAGGPGSGGPDPARALQAGTVVGRLSVVLGDSEAPARLPEVDLRDLASTGRRCGRSSSRVGALKRVAASIARNGLLSGMWRITIYDWHRISLRQGATTIQSVKWNRLTWDVDYSWADGGDNWSEPWGGPEKQWRGAILPRIRAFVPARTCLEIAPGHGRWTQFLKDLCDQLIVVDLSSSCITACEQRFADCPNIRYHVNDGRSLAMLPDGSIDFAFSFDSLVHAEADVLESYLQQLALKMTNDGVGLIHHSNLGQYKVNCGT